MGAVDLLIAVVMLAVGSGAGFAIARNQHQTSSAAAPRPDGTVVDHSSLYGELFRVSAQWQSALATFHTHLLHAFSVEEMITVMTSAIQHEFAEAGILIALGPIKDILLLQTLAAADIQAIDLNGASCIVSRPDLEGGLMRELATELYGLAKKQRATGKRWFLLRDIQPPLQARLSQRFHFAGQGMLVPIYSGEVLCGVMLLTGAPIGKNADLTLDYGRFAVMACDLMATWVRCMAPQLLAGTAADPVDTMPVHAIAALSLLEQSSEMLQEGAESREMVGELAEYAQTINTQAAETALLAMQTCHTIRRICNADFALFLIANALPNAPDMAAGFALGAVDAGLWTWSSYLGYQGGEDYPDWDDALPRDWPDRFVQTVNTTGKAVQTRTAEETHLHAQILAENFGAVSLVAIPVLMRGHCAAILVAGHKQPGGIAEQPLLVATSAAALAAMSLAAMHLMHQEHTLQQSLEQAWKIASSVAKQAIDTIVGIAQKCSVLTIRNPQKMADCAEALALQLHLSAVEVSQIRMAALLCDIGMLMIPVSILRKDGGLTSEESRLIQSHPKMSAALLDSFEIVKKVLPLILHHHEAYDGTGYPDRLSKDKIPLGARIIAIADTFIHMQMERPYRPALSRADTLAFIRQEAGKQFDPDVVQALLRVVTLEKEKRESEAA